MRLDFFYDYYYARAMRLDFFMIIITLGPCGLHFPQCTRMAIGPSGHVALKMHRVRHMCASECAVAAERISFLTKISDDG